MKFVPPKPTGFEKFLAVISPAAAEKRYRTRCALAFAESYYGGSKSRRGVSEYNPGNGDADADTLGVLPTLRDRSRDLSRNNSIAGAALRTNRTSIVGTGLKLQARPNRELLKLTDDQADAWENLVEAEWSLFCDSCDWDGVQNFSALQDLAFGSVLESGDVLVNTPYRKDPGQAYGLKIQLIEADRISNKEHTPDTINLSGGVVRENGRVVQYHVAKTHPGSQVGEHKYEWDTLSAWGDNGRRNAWLLLYRERIGQYRGIPYLAPVIEDLKQLGRYKEAELMAAVVASMFTVFIKGADGNGLDLSDTFQETGGSRSDSSFKMGNGAILDLGENEEIQIANPGRPNQAFEQFVSAIVAEIGARLELPAEVLNKRFQSSYSAALGAFLEAWRYFKVRRAWLSDSFCRPIYELFLTEAVFSGRVSAPGFLNGDPLIRKAWLGSEWIGDAPGHLDELKAVDAAKKRIDAGLSNESIETVALTGYDRDAVYRGHRKEVSQRRDDNMMMPYADKQPITQEKVPADGTQVPKA